MSSYPRRSARISHLQQEQPHQRPDSQPHSYPSSFSQSSSVSTSSHPSPVADALNPPPPPSTPQPGHPHLHPPLHLMAHQHQQQQQQQQAHIHAPLPSPSAGDIDPFFGRPHSQPNTYISPQMNFNFVNQQPLQQQSFGGEQQPQMNQQHHLHPHTNSMSQERPAIVNPLNPGQLPPNFLAEAAKRAQMACLMRDLGDVSL
ncbi:hypothetical protein A1O3_06419 [Capronia epimyces CBS 606.96]|uniref:Uncharacterized protein n=1 Tax=Capronia epimyces CBS 606.96 TaxID=1182542 RepID=W9Y036_9EURO|nr:uncharacterized protein A1O3_06419 [Capronia epimyces CBS 606.96]EXJ82606.1 hypothetical protein A1O3_06419 [Capronia epimyces CBS 606.96]